MARLFRFSIGGDFDTVEQYNLAMNLKSSLTSIGTLDACVNANKLISLWYTFCDLKNIEDRDHTDNLTHNDIVEFAIYLSNIDVQDNRKLLKTPV